MQLERYRTLIFVVFAVSSMLIASPGVEQLLTLPQTTFLTEISILGANRLASFPSNVSAGENNQFYLEVINHLGSCSYYVIEVKFRNATQSGPDSFNHTNSDLEPLSRLTLVVADKKSVEIPIDVSFQYVTDDLKTRLYLNYITLNGVSLDVSGTSIAWDPVKGGFYGNLIFELWLLNDNTHALQYHQRYVSLWFKMEA